jgi:hypothetical protein
VVSIRVMRLYVLYQSLAGYTVALTQGSMLWWGGWSCKYTLDNWFSRHRTCIKEWRGFDSASEQWNEYRSFELFSWHTWVSCWNNCQCEKSVVKVQEVFVRCNCIGYKRSRDQTGTSKGCKSHFPSSCDILCQFLIIKPLPTCLPVPGCRY